jgi:predicted PurR-regulated permease PerM
MAQPRLTAAEFFWRVVIVVSVALIPVLIWFLFDVILIVVGAILIAVLIRLLAEPLWCWGKLPESVALILSGLFIVAVVAGAGYLFGSQISGEFSDVVQRANSAMGQITKQLQASPNGNFILQHIQGGSGFSVADVLSSAFTISVRFLEAAVVTVIGGFYLAAQPQLYRSGLPYVGPIVAAIPALLVATTQGLNAVVWTLVAYILIHQIEGNLIAPLVQRQLIFIPPALMLLAIITILFVFGGFSVIFAGPIAVIIFVAVKKLYIRNSLGQETALPGEDPK